MGWHGEDLVDGPILHDAACEHHRHIVAILGHDAQVVGDDDDADLLGLRQMAQQIHDLRLHRHVQARGRLICNQKARLVDQRQGDQHPLGHAAGEFVRPGRHTPRRVRDSDQAEHVDRCIPRRCAAGSAMHALNARQLVTQPRERIERALRALHDQG